MVAVLTPRRLLVAGVAVAAAILVAGLLAARGDDGDDSPATTTTTSFPASRGAAESFVADWRRSFEATYALVTRFTRERDGTTGFESETVTVQRPPDRVVRGAGNVDARIDGRLVACATDPDSGLRCRSGPAGSYAEFVDTNVDNIADLVLGSRPLYAVAPGTDADTTTCYRLLLRFAIAAPPYGEAARVCFDDAAGAVVEVAIVREGVVDRTEAVELRGVVTEADLQLPQEAQDALDEGA